MRYLPRPTLSLCALAAATALVASCSRTQGPTPAAASPTASTALFVDVAKRAGVDFKHQLGDSGKFYIIENTAPGCAFFDYDNDGWLDAFLVQSGSAEPASQVKNRPLCGLFRNKGDGTFEDVTHGTGVDHDLGYAQGVAVGDYDNDGWDDLFVTAYGGNHLLRNMRGKFQDVTKSVGLGKLYGTGYATSAAWGDYDNDGRLDLYVCHYVMWLPGTNVQCFDRNGKLDYCPPWKYLPEFHRLYHNTPRGFVDVSARLGIHKSQGRGLAVAWVDYNADGRQDIFVANDGSLNMLWRNDGGGKFTDMAVEAGVAYGEEGRAMAAMSIAVADFDHSGRPSFFVSNYSSHPNILFRNIDGGVFEEASDDAGLSAPRRKFLSFGCEALDFDADGWSDIIVNNGHVAAYEPTREAGVPYRQRKQLLRNIGRARFREITDAGELGDLSAPRLGRGLATGDYDNDGRVDVLAMNQDAAPQLLRNQSTSGNRWASFKMIGTKSNRDGAHARLTLKAAGARQTATVRAGSSYLSSSDRRVYFGLGSANEISEVVVQWPSGARDVLRNLAPDSFYTVTEGKGVTKKQSPSALRSAP